MRGIARLFREAVELVDGKLAEIHDVERQSSEAILDDSLDHILQAARALRHQKVESEPTVKQPVASEPITRTVTPIAESVSLAGRARETAKRRRLGYLPVVLYDQNITASAGQHAQATWANARQFRRMQFHRRNSKLKGSVGDDFRIDPNLAGERGSSAKRPPSFKRLSRPDQQIGRA